MDRPRQPFGAGPLRAVSPQLQQQLRRRVCTAGLVALVLGCVAAGITGYVVYRRAVPATIRVSSCHQGSEGAFSCTGSWTTDAGRRGHGLVDGVGQDEIGSEFRGWAVASEASESLASLVVGRWVLRAGFLVFALVGVPSVLGAHFVTMRKYRRASSGQPRPGQPRPGRQRPGQQPPGQQRPGRQRARQQPPGR